MIRRERPPIAVLQHRRDDRGNLAGAGVQIAAVGVRLVAVEEGEPPAADGLLEGPDLSQEERVARHQGRLANERREGGIMVAHDVNRLHLVQSREQVQVGHNDPARIGPPEVEQVAEDVELAALGLHVVQELVESGLAALHGEIIAEATVAKCKSETTKIGITSPIGCGLRGGSWHKANRTYPIHTSIWHSMPTPQQSGWFYLFCRVAGGENATPQDTSRSRIVRKHRPCTSRNVV